MAAEGLITFEELREKLAGLEEGRTVVEEELKALEAKRSHLEQLEQDKETVLEAYAAMAPEGLEELTSGGSAKDCTRSSDSRCSCPRTDRGSQLRHVCGNGRTGGQAFCEK